MSRAYRIKVRESLQKVIKAHDHISTDLELLEILPCDEMAALLAAELERRGFVRKEGKLVREANGLSVVVDPEEGSVTVQADSQQSLELETEREGRVYDDLPRSAERRVREELQDKMVEELEQKAKLHEDKLQEEVTARLESELSDLQRELGQAVNRVTADALKQKAARIGRVKELTEDPESGSMTIVLEV